MTFSTIPDEVAALRATLSEFRDVIHDTRARRIEIEQAEYRRENDRREDLDELRKEAARRVSAINQRGVAAIETADELVRELRVERRIDPDARRRVQQLREQDVAPHAIARRAEELGDVEMAAALRSELLYAVKSRGKGRGSDLRESSASAIAAVEAVLAKIGRNRFEREDNAAACEFRGVREAFSNVRRFAIGIAEGEQPSGQTRLASAYALHDHADVTGVGAGDSGE